MLERETIYHKIRGSLYAGTIGDAMGAPTEQRNMDQIFDVFNGPVKTFQQPPEDSPYSGGREAGQITDDAGQTIEMLNAEIGSSRNITPEIVAKHLIEWSKDDEAFRRFAGPTTRGMIQRLSKGEPPEEVGRSGQYSHVGTTNGAAMKVAPAGLAHPCNIDQAVHDAVTICAPTHGTQIAFSGASAVAAAISAAFCEDADVYSMAQAGLQGAQQGYEIGLERARVTPGPSLTARMEVALNQALKPFDDIFQLGERLISYVGSGLPIAEAVPTAFGILVATGGDPFQTIVTAVNMGDDTDTVAIIAGSMAGALNGTSNMPSELMEQLESMNHIGINDLSEQLCESIMGQ